MLQQDVPEDYVIATGEQISVRDFIKMTAESLEIDLVFEGNGINEIAKIKAFNKTITPNLQVGQTIIKVDPRYFRPAEVETLLGDPTKAKEMLGWAPKKSIKELCQEMMLSDLNIARKKKILADE